MKKIIFIIICLFCLFFTFCYIQCSIVLEPDIYTPLTEQKIYYDEKGIKRNYNHEFVTIDAVQDGRSHYECTEELNLYFTFVAPEDTKRLDIYCVKLINHKTGEVIVTEENNVENITQAVSINKYYMYNKDGTNMTKDEKKLCKFWYRKGYIPTNPFNNKKGEEIAIDVEVTYKIDLGEIQISKSLYNVKIGGRHYDSESFKIKILNNLYM